MARRRSKPQNAAQKQHTRDDRSQPERQVLSLLMSWLRKEPDQAADWYTNLSKSGADNELFKP